MAQVQSDEPAPPTRRAKLALLATCGLWFTPMEDGERFTALNVAAVALAAACGITPLCVQTALGRVVATHALHERPAERDESGFVSAGRARVDSPAENL